MKWNVILPGVLAGCLLASTVLAAPSVGLRGSTFYVKESVNDDIAAKIKDGMDKVRNAAQLTFELEDIKNEDLAKICELYPAMFKLDVYSKHVTDISPIAKLTKLQRLALSVQSSDYSALKGLATLTSLDVYAPSLGADLSWMRGLTKLTSIELGAKDKTPLSLKGMPALPTLRSIKINANITDLTPMVEAMPGLTTVDLTSSTVADLSPLGKLPSLTYVNLYGATVKDFSPLAACPKLRKVTYYATKDSDYSTLGRLTQVKELDGGLTKLNDISWLSSLPNLRIFDVFAEYITDYTPLSKSKVEDFKVWNMRVPVGDLAAIGKTVSLKKLTFWDVEGARNSKSLVGLVDLQDVIIKGYNKKGGEPFDLSSASKWSKVKKAAFENADFINSDGLAGMTAVSDLKFYKANQKADKPLSLAFIGKLAALNNLNIDQCKISDSEALAKCTALTHVRIVKTEGMTSLAPLQKLPNLQRVTVSKGVYPESELKGFGPKVKVIQN